VLKKIINSAPVTLTLIGINIIVFVIFYLKVGTLEEPEYTYFLLDTGALFNPFTLDKESYRLITHMFLHGMVLHLLLNMYGLFSAGSGLEPSLGSRKFLLVYFLCGLAGAIGSLYFSLFSISVGASGAIFGLFGFSLVIKIIDTVESGQSITGIIVNFFIFLILYLFIAQNFNVDHAGHFGGMVLGVMLASVDYFFYKEYSRLRFAIIAAPILLIIFFLLPRDQVEYYKLFKQVLNAEDQSSQLFARKGLSENDFMLRLKENKAIWDSAKNSLDSLHFVRDELKEDTFKLRRYLSLRSLVNEYRLRVVNEETYILMDSIEHAEDSMKMFLTPTYIPPVRRNAEVVRPKNNEEEVDLPQMTQVWYDSNWIETEPPGVYYRMGFRDSLNQWNGAVRDFYRDGKVQMKGVYDHDQRDGIFLYYSDHNSYSSAGRYVADRRVGKWQIFHRNGRLSNEVFYSPRYFLNNVWDSLGQQLVTNGTGRVVEYYSNGRLKTEGTIFNGQRNGSWKGYYQNGDMHFLEEYNDGILLKGKSRNKNGDTFVYTQSIFYPVPVGGFEELKRYLDFEAQKLDRPETGTIEVSFRVTSDGLLTDFEFEKTVAQDIREIIKQLLLNGPSWRPAREFGYRETDGFAEVKIEF
jgi:membrane associated rhomboid family serine protease/antitoxin component YwqK of YwqJK toxin-antitoxin module